MRAALGRRAGNRVGPHMLDARVHTRLNDPVLIRWCLALGALSATRLHHVAFQRVREGVPVVVVVVCSAATAARWFCRGTQSRTAHRKQAIFIFVLLLRVLFLILLLLLLFLLLLIHIPPHLHFHFPSPLRWRQFPHSSGVRIHVELPQAYDHAGWFFACSVAERGGGFGDPFWISKSVADRALQSGPIDVAI